jgi:hypothetical protein
VPEEHTARKSVKADCLERGQYLWDEKSEDETYGPLICRAALCGPFGGGGGGGGGFDLRDVRNKLRIGLSSIVHLEVVFAAVIVQPLLALRMKTLRRDAVLPFAPYTVCQRINTNPVIWSC